ncbi:hypothetical protein [Actinoallomurus soli]|uniref:hypothetical protein n=1 Tax=Actinoallomurus soli TaxID=2952535 RepID=UPI002092DFE3|nr:hypothetical protein [Actinoallomurus soli]MCO5973419.1 hypothetical protein [Actinoallomurus soli]
MEYSGEIAPDTVYRVAEISPRGRAYLVAAYDDREPVEISTGTEMFLEPISGDARETLDRLVRKFRAATEVPAGDEAHDAAVELADFVEELSRKA